ncbi:hypothetical protein GCM10027294_01130 [Marinactinospora endophytica]
MIAEAGRESRSISGSWGRFPQATRLANSVTTDASAAPPRTVTARTRPPTLSRRRRHEGNAPHPNGLK